MSDRIIDWQSEQLRFQRRAYPAILKACRHAFRMWHERKRDDARQEALAYGWQCWHSLVNRGLDPMPRLGGIIKYAILHTRYDRLIGGTARSSVDTYQSGMKRQQMTPSGGAYPTDRSDPANWTINFDTSSRVDPADAAAFRIDTAAWLDSLPKNERMLIAGLAIGIPAVELAQKLGISVARLSQLRKQLAAQYRDMMIDLDIDDK